MDPKKRGPRPPRERLASLKDRSGRGRRRSVPAARPGAVCTNPNCISPQVVDSEGSRVCLSCGTLISESNIVADVTFGETAAGAAIVQGAYVGEGQRHAKSMGPAFRRAGATESREITEGHGRDEIRKLANSLRLNVADQAFEIYKLAITNNFIQGRRIRAVAAVCLYVACRRDSRNTTLLMDFAELIQVNVFKLGQVYQDLMKALWLTSPSSSGVRPILEVEWLIEKYARRLEFGSATLKVAEDAAKIMKRMKRDWMVSGRQPAGLCGACIILAARMNNFRRTVREVVYVVRVADVTIAKRIEEFKRTSSANLTVEQFREFGIRLKEQADPPAIYDARVRELKKKRKREQMEATDATQAEDRDAEATQVDQATQVAEGNPRRDADGFAIPAVPIDPTILSTAGGAIQDALESSNPSQDVQPQRRKVGRPPKAKAPRRPAPEIADADLLIEDELENEIERILVDPTSISHMEEAAFTAHAERAKDLADSLRNPATQSVSEDPEIGEDEFENDPEVANCILTEAERNIKERIWVTHNEDWLRAQQAKILKKSLEEASGATKKVRRRRRRGRLGDGSVLEGDTPVESAAEANQRMLDRRSKGFSKYINYEKLNSFYRGFLGTSRGGDATSASRSESDAASETSGPASSTAAASTQAGAPGLPTPDATQPTPAQGRATRSSARRNQPEAETAENVEDEEEGLDDEDEVEEDFEEDYDEDDEEEDIGGTLRAFGVDGGDDLL